MRKITAFIPNLLTLCNLLSGCIAVSVLFLDANHMQAFWLAFWLVIASAVFDFFDGFAARMLNVMSPIGKELDSLADMVSFGLVPSCVIFVMLSQTELAQDMPWIVYVGFLIALCSAYRLAKFNVDDRQSDEFRGLPTPACALFFVALPMLDWNAVSNPAVLITLTVMFAALMVCDMPMFSLKFKTFGVKKNGLRYVFMTLSVIFMVWLGMAAPAMIILSYILISAGQRLVCRKCING